MKRGKITEAEKLDNMRNITGMINDYQIQGDRVPTANEIAEKLGMSACTVRRYKRIIREKDREVLLDIFNVEIIIHARKALETVNKNIRLFEKIRDTSEDKAIAMLAAKNLLDSHIDAIRIMIDLPAYLGNDDAPDKKQYTIGKTTERRLESI